MRKILVKNISEIVTTKNQIHPIIENYAEKLFSYKNAALEIIGNKFGDILDNTPEIDYSNYDEIIDAKYNCVIPGFVDSHTHALFPEYRENEFDMRLKGASYLEILNNGGGILSSAKKLASKSKDELLYNLLKRLDTMIHFGTTTVEIKSGYGLDYENEIKMLEVINEANLNHPIDIVPTFMGAHAVPKKFNSSSKYIKEIKRMIDTVSDRNLAIFNDVFCEKGVFSAKESHEILEYGKKKGLGAKIHADEIEPIGGIEVACKVGAISAEHLLATTDESIKLLASNGVIANLLPATAFFLRKKSARAKVFIENKCPVAISTDCNPGSSMTESMQFAITAACLNMNMSIQEAIIAATYNGACAINMQKTVGSIEKGKQADCIIVEGNTYKIIPYHFAVNNVKTVIKKGKVFSQ